MRKRRKQYLKFAPSFEKGTEADEERMEKKDSRSLRKEKRRRKERKSEPYCMNSAKANKKSVEENEEKVEAL